MRSVGYGVSTAIVAILVFAGLLVEAKGLPSTWSYFQAIRNMQLHYPSMVCEQVAKIDLEKQFDRSLYWIDTNLNYGYSVGMQLGELDVVVFDRITRTAVRIYEIKCWAGAEGRALRKANQQRKRFFDEINFGPGPSIWSMKSKYSVRQFRGMPPENYKIGGPSGSVGFDYQLPLTLDQLNQLFAEVKECQKVGDCAQR